jgi:hypothetical protein
MNTATIPKSVNTILPSVNEPEGIFAADPPPDDDVKLQNTPLLIAKYKALALDRSV